MATVERNQPAKRTRRRKYRKLPESAALEMMAARQIVVNTLTGDVYSAGRRRALTFITPTQCKNGYLHVRLYRDKARRSFAVHRLVVMAATGELIPAHCEVDHEDTNRQHNSIRNLVVKDCITHRKQSAYKRHWGPNGLEPLVPKDDDGNDSFDVEEFT